MVKVPPKVKELKGYDELRRLRNHLRDDCKTLKCKTGSKVKSHPRSRNSLKGKDLQKVRKRNFTSQ